MSKTKETNTELLKKEKIQTYTYDEVLSSSIKYFNGDELAATTWMNKYAMKDFNDNYVEQNPSDMHRRMAKEFGRIEAQFGGDRALSEDQIYDLLKDFKYIVPQGSPMMGIGNNHVNVSLSNCVVVDSPNDNV